MNQTDFERYTKYLLGKSAGLLVSKGRDYATSGDRLENFKRGAGLTGAKPVQVAFIYMSKHFDALATYIKETTAKVKDSQNPYAPSEPIEGRLCDLINYAILIAAILHEEQCLAAPKTRGGVQPAGD